MNAKYFFLLSLAFAFGASASENTILLAEGVSKGGGNSLSIDLALTDDVSAFNFLIALPKGATNIDTSKCLSALPATHTGKCGVTAHGDKVAVVVYSANNQALPIGLTSIGEINYSKQLASRRAGEVKLEKVKLASPRRGSSVSFDVKSVDLARN